MSGHAARIEPGSEAYSRELERLTELAPSLGYKPVTADPVINAHLAEHLPDLDEDMLERTLAILGIVRPEGHGSSFITVWLGDRDLHNPGIVAWSGFPERDDEA